MSANDSDKRKTQARAVRPRRRSVVLRPILDAIVAGTVFLFLTCLTSSAPVRACPFSAAFAGIEHSIKPSTLKAVGEPGPAPIIEIATTSSAWDSNAVFRRTSDTAAWSLLGLSISLLAALDLAIFRHLRRVYAVQRRRNPEL
ncbi:MAG TPA: hypothetical protein VIF13_04210 [Hyphomicrobium sp.]|jgi:hypothetical protein